MPTIAYHTLGCKVNQYDTQAMEEILEKAGFQTVPFSARADVYLINTCTVTGTGDKKSLQTVRRIRRMYPESRIVLCGCMAQLYGEELLSKTGADLIIGGHLHGGIIRLPFIGGLISPRHRLFPHRTKGLFEEGKGKLLVTSGVGWHALPFRFLNNPEICVLEVPAVKAGD